MELHKEKIIYVQIWFSKKGILYYYRKEKNTPLVILLFQKYMILDTKIDVKTPEKTQITRKRKDIEFMWNCGWMDGWVK